MSGKKPNIILLVSDDFGYGDAGVYGGGEGRGMPTPNLDRLAKEGMQFYSFYAQPSCTPGRAAMQTGRIPNRSGMTTVAFQGQGGGLPAAEWTLGVGAEDRRLQHLLHREVASRRIRLRLAQRAGLRRHEVLRAVPSQRVHLRRPGLVPGHARRDLREMFAKVTKGMLSGNAGEKPHEEFKVNGEYENTPEKGVVGIPFLDEYIEGAALDYLDEAVKIGHAVLHERQFHEGPPAESAPSRLHPQVHIEEQVRGFRR